MKKPNLAFLVCAYNAEKYIDQTIQSILAQTFEDFVLYIRDNGSTDTTYKICEKYANQDSRIILMHNQINGHDFGHELPHTFDKPYSKYLTHLDADDYIHPDFARITVEMAEKHAADIVVVGSKNFNDGETAFCSTRTQKDLIYNENDTLTVEDFSDKYSQLRPLWAKIYNTDFFYDIDWNDVVSWYSGLLRGHDTALSICQILRAKKVVFMSECVHYHRYRYDSDFIDSFMPDYRRVFDGLTLYNLGLKLLDKFKCNSVEGTERIRNIFYGHLYSLIDLLVDPLNQNYEFKYAFVENLVNDSRFEKVVELLNEVNIHKIFKPLFDDLAKQDVSQDEIVNSFFKRYVYSQYKAQSMATQKLLMISAVFDKNNKFNFGLDQLFYWKSEEKIPKWYINFVALEKNQQEEMVNNSEKMHMLIGYDDSSVDYNLYKNYILDLIDVNRINDANDFNEYILGNKPLDREALYFKTILLNKMNKIDEYFDLSLLIKFYYREDEDLLFAINKQC